MSRTSRTKASRRAKRRHQQLLRQTRRATKGRNNRDRLFLIFDALQLISALITITTFVVVAVGTMVLQTTK